jgi:hypothetical protein
MFLMYYLHYVNLTGYSSSEQSTRSYKHIADMLRLVSDA